ncbi:MAG: ABC transporter substrate-binding protein, partial [Candidatus Dormibacteraceae bacterium]
MNTDIKLETPPDGSSNGITRRRFVGIASVAVVGAGGLESLLAACGPSTSPPKTGNTVSVGIPSLGSESWTPWLSSGDEEVVTHIVGETLLRNDPKTRALQPGLATEWNVSSDGMTWTFKLRSNVPFH